MFLLNQLPPRKYRDRDIFGLTFNGSEGPCKCATPPQPLLRDWYQRVGRREGLQCFRV